MRPIRVVLADDHPLIREAIGHLVTAAPEFQIIAEASDGQECLDLVRRLLPDILVLDIAMPRMDGEHVTRELKQHCPAVKIVALSGYTDRQFVHALIKAGADGYVVKSASGRELIQALRAVSCGKSYLSPEVTAAVMKPLDSSPPSEPSDLPLKVLGKREIEVLRLIAEGHRGARIADQLGIAVATVGAHRRNILRKLKLHSAAELTRYAVRHGLLSP